MGGLLVLDGHHLVNSPLMAASPTGSACGDPPDFTRGGTSQSPHPQGFGSAKNACTPLRGGWRPPPAENLLGALLVLYGHHLVNSPLMAASPTGSACGDPPDFTRGGTSQSPHPQGFGSAKTLVRRSAAAGRPAAGGKPFGGLTCSLWPSSCQFSADGGRPQTPWRGTRPPAALPS